MPDMRNAAEARIRYLERPPERLVLDGYRHWTRGSALRSTGPWTQAQLLYRGILGDEDGERAIIALARFTKTLGACAACRLRVFNVGSHFICRDETLVMGLIAGIQHGDAKAAVLCLDRLCGTARWRRAAIAAGEFALTLTTMEQTMVPIPAHVLQSILDRSRSGSDDGLMSDTIH